MPVYANLYPPLSAFRKTTWQSSLTTALTAATDGKKTRDDALNHQLAKLSRQKASVATPFQVIRALSDVLPLPVALSLTGRQGG